LAAVFLIGIGPKSLEAQNEAVHPIGFIRRDEQPHPSMADEIHALSLLVFTRVNGRLIVKTDENLKSIPLIGPPFRSLKGDFSRAFAKVSGRIKTG
jgi:hypothetical protein